MKELTGPVARTGLALLSLSVAFLVVASTALASAPSLPNPCTLLTAGRAQHAFGHGKTLAVGHRKHEKYGSGRYLSLYCSETVGTQPVSINVMSGGFGGFGGVRITSETHPAGLGSDATLITGVGAGNGGGPVDFINFHRMTIYVDISANGASPSTVATFARTVYKLLP